MSEPKATAEQKPEEGAVKPPKASSPLGKTLLIVAIALGSSAGGGVVSWLLISRTMSATASTTTEEPPAEPEKTEEERRQEELDHALEKGAALQLEPFVVNLADADAARYLRIKISLMIDDKAQASHIQENSALQHKVRDVILETLTRKTSDELITDEGKKKLRVEIQEKLAGYFKESKLVDVMFTEFVIQL